VKRVITFFFGLTSLFIAALPLYSQSYTTNLRSKTIHVVFDDSVSMVRDDNRNYVDSWGQAKYAMEVFAVMLEENDTMRVYFLSDFDLRYDGNINADAKIIISGSEPRDTRVRRIREAETRAANTPYDAVIKAYDDLRNAPGDERWLVVMNDGDDFNRLRGQDVPNVDVDSYFSGYVRESDVKIVLLAIGDVLKSFKSDPGRNILLEHARNSGEILGRITSICNRIFNRNSLNFTNEARYESSFDIPMIELLVFAQGADISINGINNGAGTSNPNDTVDVRYSEVAPTYRDFDRSRIKISRELTGTVAVFRNVPKGAYSLDITGVPKTVDVYYKPDAKVDIRLYQRGREVRAQDIHEGRYEIRYGIVDEKGSFFESTLLGSVEYKATVQNGGQSVPVRSGDTIDLKEGDLKINVQAQFLEINTTENTITRRVLIPPPLKDRIRDWIKKYWYIFWPLVFLLAGLLLYWLLWGRKKRFPKYMRSKPTIKVERDGNTVVKYGSFKINKKTKWLPFCPETGSIVAAADGKPLPSLKVRSLGNDSMELTNTGDFSADRLNGVEFYINDQALAEGSTRKKTMSCTARIKSVYYNAGIQITHTCSFARKGKKGKK